MCFQSNTIVYFHYKDLFLVLFDVKFNQFNSNILVSCPFIAAAPHFNIISCRGVQLCCEPGRGIYLTLAAVAWTTPLSIQEGFIRMKTGRGIVPVSQK